MQIIYSLEIKGDSTKRKYDCSEPDPFHPEVIGEWQKDEDMSGIYFTQEETGVQYTHFYPWTSVIMMTVEKTSL